MKRLLASLMMITILMFNVSLLKAQKNSESENAKLIHLDLGYGPQNLSAGAGFKYSFSTIPFSLGGVISVAGLTTDIPQYGYKLGVVNIAETKSYPTFLISGDVNLYYEWKDYSFFGTIGFYSQSDTVLGLEFKNNATNYYYERHESSSGATFGAGVQYYYSDFIVLGLGYQNKKGVYLQLGYTWF